MWNLFFLPRSDVDNRRTLRYNSNIVHDTPLFTASQSRKQASKQKEFLEQLEQEKKKKQQNIEEEQEREKLVLFCICVLFFIQCFKHNDLTQEGKKCYGKLSNIMALKQVHH